MECLFLYGKDEVLRYPACLTAWTNATKKFLDILKKNNENQQIISLFQDFTLYVRNID